VGRVKKKEVDKPTFHLLSLSRPGEHGSALDFLINGLKNKGIAQFSIPHSPFPIPQTKTMPEGDIKKYNLKELLAVIYIGVTVSLLLLAVRHLGGLQSLELAVFDRLVQLRPAPGPDPRLLVVEVTEEDIEKLQEWPLKDRTLARVLATLQGYEPAVIGLDLARNLANEGEEGYEELVAQMNAPNFIAITSVGNRKDRSDRIPPPPSVPKERVGSIDVPIDPDNVMRRHLLFNYDGEVNWLSWSLRLARTYMKLDCPGYRSATEVRCKNIEAKLTEEQEYQLGDVVFHKLKPHSGGYQTINAGGYQILTDYRSENNVANTISLVRLLEGDFEPELVKDKIVLIGVSAPSEQDLFFTPFSSAIAADEPRMPGVVIQAQMVSQILSAVLDGDRLFWYWPEWVEVFWIVGWTIAGGSLAALSRKPLILVMGTGVLLILLWGSTFILFLQQGWMPLAAPTLGIILAVGAIVFYKESQAELQQQMVMRLLGQQTSPEIADALWQSRDRLLDSGRLPWQKLTATLFFSDIKGFSTISEEMQDSPEKLMGWLNEYLNAMSDEVLAHQGIVNKFMGDGMMAVFGVPIAATTEAEIAADAQRAVNCALAIREKLAELNCDWQSRQLPAVQMRVGIFTGVAMVGSLGGKNRLEYAVIGDATNTASRLESSFKERQIDDCRILIGKETLQHLDDKFEVEEWGALPVKGKKQTVAVYRVIGRRHSS
jgi:adenylate cyclase